jgi:serine-type D-Ala-D-Ala carboxypeptidase (penicillin-binding protein 5/6)
MAPGESGRLMLDRFGRHRTVLAAAGTVLTSAVLTSAVLTSAVLTSAVMAALVAVAPGASAASPPPPATAPPTSGAHPAAIGGAQLAGRGVIVDYAPAPATSRVPKLPAIQASAWLIADAGTGQVLAAKDPHGWYRPASTLKVLTAISLIPVLNPDATTVTSKQATSVSPNIVGLLAGHAYKISDLFTALLTISANDAAMALAQAAGSLSQGMGVINAEARHLQAGDTVAVTPNGLDAPGQHTSAYDLALFARQALTIPAFLKYDQTTSAAFRISRKKSVGLYNQNSLLATYPGAIGGKIGWTSAAGATYVGMAKRNGHTLIVTLLHCPALTEIDAAKSLLNWGFKVDGTIAPIGALVGPRPPAAAAPTPSHPAIAAQRATPAQAAPGGPSLLATAGFSVAALLAAGFGFAYSRRQRPARRRAPGGSGSAGSAGSVGAAGSRTGEAGGGRPTATGPRPTATGPRPTAGEASGPRPRAGDDRSTARRP